MSSTPTFFSTPKIGIATISTANTGRDGSGTLGTVFTAGSNGSRIEHIDVIAQGTTTAGRVRLFIYNGATAYLWREIAVAALVPSGTVGAFRSSVDCSDPNNLLVLPSGYSLRASTHNAETFNVIAIGADA